MAESTAELSQLSPAQLSRMALMPAPPGFVADLDGPNPSKTLVISLTSIFMGFAFLFGGVRAYIKIKIHGRGSWDDVTFALGLMCTMIYWVVFLLQVENEGFGKHLWNIPLIVVLSDTFAKLGYLSDWLCNVAYIFVKLTFFILYWIIFKPFRWLRFAIISGAIIVTSVYTGCTLASLISATPRPGQSWRESNNKIGQRLAIPIAAWSLASDVFILLLPIAGILRLQLSSKRRYALLMLFMTGIGCCICSSLSLYFRTRYDADTTFSVVKIEILIIVELCVGICITCMPTTSVAVRHLAPHLDTLRVKILSYSGKLRSSLSPQRSSRSYSSKSRGSNTAGADGPYRNLEAGKTMVIKGKEAFDLRQYPLEGVRTNVSTGLGRGVSDDKIYLKVNLEQV